MENDNISIQDEMWSKVDPKFKGLSESIIIDVLERDKKVKKIVQKRREELRDKIIIAISSISLSATLMWGGVNLADSLERGKALKPYQQAVEMMIENNSTIERNENTGKVVPMLNHLAIAKEIDSKFVESEMEGKVFLAVLYQSLSDREYNMPLILDSISSLGNEKDFLSYVESQGFSSIEDFSKAMGTYVMEFNNGKEKTL